MDELFVLMRSPQFAPMFLSGLMIGFIFAAFCYKRPSLIVDVVSAAFALIPIWIVGSGLLMQDLKLGLYSAMFLFLGLGVGFLLIGLAIGAALGFASAKVLPPPKD